MKSAPRAYFSFRSPYSWLAFHDLRLHSPRLLREIEWRPFWEPDAEFDALLTRAGGEFPYTPMSRAKHFYLLRDVRRLARRRGLTNCWPADVEPRWEPAHLTWFVAEDAGLALEYMDRVYAARWLEDADICDPRVVGAVARAVGVDVDMDAVLASPALRARALDALLAVCADDVFGVPMFLRGRDKYWGLDRLADFVAAVAPEPIPDLPDTVAAGLLRRTADVGHAGGCG
ncbi:DsbA family protein [Nocardia arizonensis]|uniref:DsbA family protein n=1 Tax=Nocardia arizonensis TaxID=1141647 RepID=UPI0006D0A443|nr:DsbA family protein [Nocardia arizonensis]